MFDFFGRFGRDRRGNVTLIFGLAAIPLTFAIGMAVDYGNNARKWSQLNAAADAAALAATTQPMMQQSTATAQTAAENMFAAQASGIANIVPGTLNVNISFATSGYSRTVTVSYTAQFYNVFGGVLGQSTMSVSGSSQANTQLTPSINFYVLADTSPSMAVAATTAGITTLQNNTLGQWGASGGCAFACHEQNPAADCLGNWSPCEPLQPTRSNPGGIDDYALARQLGVTLRIDNLQTAVQTLASTASSAQVTNNVTYNMAIYTFDANFNTITGMTTPSSAQTAANNIKLLEIYQAGYVTRSSQYDEFEGDTASTSALTSINNLMPNPGIGTTSSPQEFLFIITDGIENDSSGIGLLNTELCTTIKNRGIQIGVVYTTYYPIPTYFPYQDYVEPIQSQIGPNLQACASSPSFYQEVNTDGDIGQALQAIFAAYTASSHLIQ
jgi:Flp pilus assembly protein TadG